MPEPSTGGPFLRTPWRGLLFHGDNARVMPLLEPDLASAVDLIYADPPFAIGESLRFGARKQARERTHGEPAYRDVWQGGIAAYTAMLRERLTAMRRLLAPSGGLFLHLDWRACHHGRLLLDEIFGAENFRNEIVWHYGGRGAKAGAGQFPRNHDTILFYSKSTATRFATPHVEDRLSPEAARARGYRRGADGRWFKTAPRGDYTDESMARLDAEGRVHRTRTGSARVKYSPTGGGRPRRRPPPARRRVVRYPRHDARPRRRAHRLSHPEAGAAAAAHRRGRVGPRRPSRRLLLRLGDGPRGG